MKLETFLFKLKDSFDEFIYFGGSFNPWHEGHSECLRRAPKAAAKIVIPDHNPLKALKKRDIQLPDKLLDLNQNIYVYLGFFKQDKQNPTADWLPDLVKSLPGHQHALLMGYDSYLKLADWYRYKSILKSIDKLYVLDRENEGRETLYDVKTEFLGEHPYEQLSSTNIRLK